MRKPAFTRSVRNALHGILYLLKCERNFQIELLAFGLNVLLIVVLKVEKTDAALLLLAAFVVLIAEGFNTVIEKISDYIQPEFDEKIGLIKDIAAGGVVLAVITTLVLAVIIYPSYL